MLNLTIQLWLVLIYLKADELGRIDRGAIGHHLPGTVVGPAFLGPLMVAVILRYPVLLPLALPVGFVVYALANANRYMRLAVTQLALECAASLGMDPLEQPWEEKL